MGLAFSSLARLSGNTAKCECLAHSQGPLSRQGDREGTTLSLCQCLLACSCQLPAGMKTKCPVSSAQDRRLWTQNANWSESWERGKIQGFPFKPPAPCSSKVWRCLHSFIHSFVHSSHKHSWNTRLHGCSSVGGRGGWPCPCWDRNRNGQRARHTRGHCGRWRGALWWVLS